MTRPYAIIVDIPAPENEKDECFVAYPFQLAQRDDYPITDVLNKAIQRAHMEPMWPDREGPGVDIMRNVQARIRSAAIVIAICTPENGGVKANPNVMYELGFAESIGKPTLMVTTDVKSLPFDVSHKMAFVYDPADTKINKDRESLIARLRTEIDELKDKAVAPGVNVLKGVGFCRAIVAKDRAFLLPAFWHYVAAVEKSDYKIIDEITQLDRNAVDLERHARMLASGESDSEMRELLGAWVNCRHVDAGRVRPCLEEVADLPTTRMSALVHDPAWTSLPALETDWKNLIDAISKYTHSFEELEKAIALQLHSPNPGDLYDSANAFYEMTGNLRQRAIRLNEHLDRTIYESFEVIT